MSFQVEEYGSYQLLKRLATGGMAEIYLAKQSGPEGFEKLLVVKRILPHLSENEEFVKMFLDEARIAARLNHPNIAQIYNLGAVEESYFIAMEYIHGEDLRRVWKRTQELGQAMPVPLVCRVIMEICAGLDYAHNKADPTGKPLGIVHRDISPQNVLLTFDGGVKIVDFGIAKAVIQASQTRSGVLKGKYSYMSPEQAAGKRLDRRTDIFALGVIFHELLTGSRLFKRGTDVETLTAVSECKVPAPSSVNARLSKALDDVVLRALAKDPAERYPDAVSFQIAIENWLVSHKLPSSSAHLSTFMKEIYAERLQEEEASNRASAAAAVGSTVLTELSANSQDETIATLQGKTISIRSAGPHRPGRAELPREIPKQLTEVSAGVYSGRRRLSVLQAAWVVAAASVIGVAGWQLWAKTRPANPGEVRGQGAPTVAAPPRTPGADAETPRTVPARQNTATELGLDLSHESPGARVVREAGGARERTRVEETALVERRVISVELRLSTDPDGAQVFVNGTPLGSAPVALDVAARSQVAVRLEAPGYPDLERRIPIGSRPVQRERLVMTRGGPAAAEGSAGGKGRPAKGLVDEERRGTGTVRFAVTPWAEVSCGSHRLGSTPFGDQQLPAGTYQCRFVNPELGTRTRRVEVRPNVVSRVIVVF